MDEEHVIHKNADGSEYWITCDGKEFARFKAIEILNWDQPEKYFDLALASHNNQVHKISGDAPIHGGSEDTANDTEHALRVRLDLQNEVVEAARELYNVMDSLVQKPGKVRKSWETPLPLAANGLNAMTRLGLALDVLDNVG